MILELESVVRVRAWMVPLSSVSKPSSGEKRRRRLSARAVRGHKIGRPREVECFVDEAVAESLFCDKGYECLERMVQ